MRVVILGASGNVGTSVIHALAHEDRVTSVLGLCRRPPELSLPKVTWAKADMSEDDLVPHFRDADAVVHLAWLIQPSRDEAYLERVNLGGTHRVLDAVRAAGVKNLIYASSVGAYGPGPKDRPVDESWPTTGIQENYYCRQKAEVERILDLFDAQTPDVRVVRMRKAFAFKREAATGIRRLFMGPFFPSPLLRPGLTPALPDVGGLSFQAVHSLDAGDAYRIAIVSPHARGPYNIAATPILTMKHVAELLHAWTVPVPRWMALRGMGLAWLMRLIPSPSSWLKAGLELPIMDITRAHRDLGWWPRHTAMEAVSDLIEGLRASEGLDTPPLSPDTTGPLRWREVATGVGGTDR
jgi:UDP-glucose 4-epimerase